MSKPEPLAVVIDNLMAMLPDAGNTDFVEIVRVTERDRPEIRMRKDWMDFVDRETQFRILLK